MHFYPKGLYHLQNLSFYLPFAKHTKLCIDARGGNQVFDFSTSTGAREGTTTDYTRVLGAVTNPKPTAVLTNSARLMVIDLCGMACL